VIERRSTQQDAGCDSRKPRPNEAAPEEERRAEPTRKERQRIPRIAGRGEVAVMRELPDRREGDDGKRARERGASQRNRRAPRKSFVRTGTMRTSLAEFGDSIMRPPPMYMAT
jgi:hypothetical protein